ncbi:MULTISPECIES: hypothetical protein [Morganellaceae]|uniref:hypothetical protein n=1 Tax=Morganellaceae TaxID=1903414 RepID=UPI001F1EE372|nr:MULTISPECIES: hypothetical protein [Morganellaceae]MDM3563952.1 hypothetical protein [Proteus vulgaris]WOC00694.1 hypothetical protein P3L55_05135 [Providencia sp. PROV046]
MQKAKQEGKYKGRLINKILHQKIEGLLMEGKSYSQIENLIGCSRHTISKVSKAMKIKKYFIICLSGVKHLPILPNFDIQNGMK